jgi:hypothetical protein
MIWACSKRRSAKPLPSLIRNNRLQRPHGDGLAIPGPSTPASAAARIRKPSALPGHLQRHHFDCPSPSVGLGRRIRWIVRRQRWTLWAGINWDALVAHTPPPSEPDSQTPDAESSSLVASGALRPRAARLPPRLGVASKMPAIKPNSAPAPAACQGFARTKLSVFFATILALEVQCSIPSAS